ncbi:MAG: hypothetical protein J6B04_00915 [Clostridia bacterium]|nr:hypothetical protein [Clostridia bacterium]
MVKYVKCPRCELNYIDSETQEYCDVCIAEIKGNKLQFADLEDDDFVDEMGEDKTELCPVCGINHMHFGEAMCDSCKKRSEYEDDVDIDPDKDEEWKNYLDDDTDDLTIDDEALDEEMRDEFDEAEEEMFDEYNEDDDLSDFDEGDFDDDFDDEDDDDDDDDF